MAYTKAQNAIITKLSKSINTAALRDIRFMKLVRKTMRLDAKDNPLEAMGIYTDIIERLFTEEQEGELYKAFEDADGIADSEIVGRAIADIMQRSKEVKKSSPSGK